MEKEKIVCAAIKLGDVIVQGVRHSDCIRTVQGLLGPLFDISYYIDNGKYTEGFVTNIGRFMDREEAYKFAVESGFIEPSEPEILASEDLY